MSVDYLPFKKIREKIEKIISNTDSNYKTKNELVLYNKLDNTRLTSYLNQDYVIDDDILPGTKQISWDIDEGVESIIISQGSSYNVLYRESSNFIPISTYDSVTYGITVNYKTGYTKKIITTNGELNNNSSFSVIPPTHIVVRTEHAQCTLNVYIDEGVQTVTINGYNLFLNNVLYKDVGTTISWAALIKSGYTLVEPTLPYEFTLNEDTVLIVRTTKNDGTTTTEPKVFVKWTFGSYSNYFIDSLIVNDTTYLIDSSYKLLSFPIGTEINWEVVLKSNTNYYPFSHTPNKFIANDNKSINVDFKSKVALIFEFNSQLPSKLVINDVEQILPSSINNNLILHYIPGLLIKYIATPASDYTYVENGSGEFNILTDTTIKLNALYTAAILKVTTTYIKSVTINDTVYTDSSFSVLCKLNDVIRWSAEPVTEDYSIDPSRGSFTITRNTLIFNLDAVYNKVDITVYTSNLKQLTFNDDIIDNPSARLTFKVLKNSTITWSAVPKDEYTLDPSSGSFIATTNRNITINARDTKATVNISISHCSSVTIDGTTYNSGSFPSSLRFDIGKSVSWSAVPDSGYELPDGNSGTYSVTSSSSLYLFITAEEYANKTFYGAFYAYGSSSTPTGYFTFNGVRYNTREGSYATEHLTYPRNTAINWVAYPDSGWVVDGSSSGSITLNKNDSIWVTVKKDPSIVAKVYCDFTASHISYVKVNDTYKYYPDTTTGIEFDKGSTVNWEVSPYSSYTVSVAINGVTQSGLSGSFTINSDTTIKVTLSTITYNKVYRSLDAHTASISINGTSYSTSDTSSGIQVQSNSTVSWSVTPSSGYRVKSVTIGSNTTSQSSGSFTITSDTTITVTTEVIPTSSYTVSWGNLPTGVAAITVNGTRYTSSGSISVSAGSLVTYSIEAATGYNAPSGSPSSPITVNSNTTISITSGSIKTYTFKYTKDSHVSKVTINGTDYTDSTKTLTFNYGTKVLLTATAASGYHIVSGAPITINSITKNEETSITSEEDTPDSYTVSWTLGTGVASITVAGTKYTSNGSKSFTAGTSISWSSTASTGYTMNSPSSGTISSISKNETISLSATINSYTFSWTISNNVTGITINGTKRTSNGSISVNHGNKVTWSNPTFTNNTYLLASDSATATGEVTMTGNVSKTWKATKIRVTISWNDLPTGIASITIGGQTFNRGGAKSVTLDAGNISWSVTLDTGYEISSGSSSGTFSNCISNQTITLPGVSIKRYSVTFIFNDGIDRYSFTVKDENNVSKNSGTIYKPNDSNLHVISGLQHGWHLYWTAYAKEGYALSAFEDAVLADNKSSITGDKSLTSNVTISPTATKTSCKINVVINEGIDNIVIYRTDLSGTDGYSRTFTSSGSETADIGTSWAWHVGKYKDGYEELSTNQDQIVNIQSDVTISPTAIKSSDGETVMWNFKDTEGNYTSNYTEFKNNPILYFSCSNATPIHKYKITKVLFLPNTYEYFDSKVFICYNTNDDGMLHITIKSSQENGTCSITLHPATVPNSSSPTGDTTLPWEQGTLVVEGNLYYTYEKDGVEVENSDYINISTLATDVNPT